MTAMNEQEEFEFRLRAEQETKQKAKPPKPTFWEVVKEQAKPDMFRTGELAYKLGGEVTDATGSPALGYVANVAAQALPTIVGAFGGSAAAPVMQEGAKRVMTSAVKPTLDQVQKGNAAKAITTMLEEGVNATPGGLAALRSQISSLNNEIAAAIQGSSAVVDKGAVASRLGDAVRKFERQVNPNADLATIQKAWTEFLSHPLMSGQAKIPVQLAQELKQGTYRALGNKSFGELKGAEIEAQKALARGLKEEIAAAVPKVGPLNAMESELINAANVLGRRVAVQGNQNPIGLGALATSPGNMALWLADRSAWVKSMLARAMYSGSGAIPTSVGGTVGAAIGANSGMPSANYGLEQLGQ